MAYMYTKQNVQPIEYHVHHMVYNSRIVNIPRPYKYEKETQQFHMQRIPNMSVADYYGEDFESVPKHIIDKIRETVDILYRNGIEYPDITGYNFIEWKNKIWIIDFEHASYRGDLVKFDPFVLKFIQGYNGWNPEYS